MSETDPQGSEGASETAAEGTEAVAEQTPEGASPTPSKNVVRRLYDWVLGWADTPYGVPALFLLAFTESSFFPIPPDLLLIALALAAPTRAFYFALWCTAGSVLGGMFGYLIGFAMWEFFEPLLIRSESRREDFDFVCQQFNSRGELWVFIGAFTPIPYKVLTVASGVTKLRFVTFVVASMVGRAGRFFLVSLVIRLTGNKAKELIDRYFNLFTILFGVLLIAGFLVIRFLRH